MIKKADIILISTVLAVSLLLIFFNTQGSKGSAPYAVITGGGESRRVRLAENSEIVIRQGEMLNIITLESGKISMSSSNCPNGHCVRQGAISKRNQIIVCVPHKVIIEIISGKEAEYDAFTG